MSLTIGSLFSGIGGLELGLEMAGLGPVVWQVEKDEFCKTILQKHWPEVERHDDVGGVGQRNLQPVDLICGGFPCQDVSHCGTRSGLSGDRSGLWFEFIRIVRELRPRFVVVENSGNLVRKGLGTVLKGLADEWYDAIWFALRACDVGAPHRRTRMWIVAYRDHIRRESVASARVHDQGQLGHDVDGRGVYPPQRGAARAWQAHTDAGRCQPGLFRSTDGLFSELDRARLRALGNAVVPECAQVVGEVVNLLMRAEYKSYGRQPVRAGDLRRGGRLGR